jgi:predicted Zn-dependent protease with MMP-like domain
MIELSEKRFEEIVTQALDDMPEWVGQKVQNLAVVIRPWPSPQQVHKAQRRGRMLLGLYEGVPLTRRGHAYRLVTPDQITLFQHPLQRAAATEEELARLVRRTVIHEIGHHFGFSEADLNSLGL